MSLRRNLVRSSALNLVDHAVKFGVVLLITPLLISGLGEFDYGVWLLLMTVFSYYHLLDLGLTLSCTHFVARAIGKADAGEQARTLGTITRAFRIVALVSAGVTVVLIALAGVVAKDAEVLATSRIILAIYGANVVLRFLFRVYQVILKSHVRYDCLVGASLTRTAVQTGFIIAIMQSGGGLRALVIVYGLSEVLEHMLIWVFAKRLSRGAEISAKNYDGKLAREMFRYARTTFLATIGHNLRNRIDPLLVGGLRGAAAVPIYSIGTRFLTFFVDLVNAILGGQFIAVFSQLKARDQHGQARDLLKLALKVSVAVSFLGGSALLFYGAPFILRWVGPAFDESAIILWILVGPYVLHMMQYPAMSFFYSVARHHYITRMTLIGGAANLVLSIILGLIYGMLGIVIATAIEMFICYGLVLPILVSKVAEIPLRDYLLRHLLLPALLYSLPLAAYYLLISPFIEADYLRLVLCGSGHVAVFALFFWACGLSRDEKKQLAGMFRRTDRPPTNPTTSA